MPQDPENENVELEALVQQGMDSKESLDNIEMNTQISAASSKEALEVLESSEALLGEAVVGIRKVGEVMEPVKDSVSKMAAFLSDMKGEKGDRGDRGEKGEKGDKGDTGADSTVPGPVGPRGEPGRDGTDGVDGRDGKDGAPGADGRDGVDGKTGPRGPAGKDGKTPKKGKEYFTEEEVEEITRQAIERARIAISSRTYGLGEMEDVELSSPNNNSTLQYQTASRGWINGISITVSATEPIDPKENDLWIMI